MKKIIIVITVLTSAGQHLNVHAAQSSPKQEESSWFKGVQNLYNRLTNSLHSPQLVKEDFAVGIETSQEDVENGEFVAIGGSGMVRNEGAERLGKMTSWLREMQSKISVASFELLNQILQAIGKRFADNKGVITQQMDQDLMLIDSTLKKINNLETDADSEVIIEAAYMSFFGKRPVRQDVKVEQSGNLEGATIAQLQAELVKAQERIKQIEVNSQQVTPQAGVVGEALKRELQELKQKNKNLEDQVTSKQKELERFDHAQQACKRQAKKLEEQAKILEQFEELQRQLDEQRDRYEKQLEDSKKQAELYLKQSVAVKSASSASDEESEEALRQMNEEIRKKDQELQRLYDLLKQSGVTSGQAINKYVNSDGEEVFEG